MTGIHLLTAASRLADRLWERHSRGLQEMTDQELLSFAAEQLAPLHPTFADLHGVVQQLQAHQRDNARPPDDPPATDDPLDRLFQ